MVVLLVKPSILLEMKEGEREKQIVQILTRNGNDFVYGTFSQSI